MKVGDRVIIIDSLYGYLTNLTGTIVDFLDENTTGVEFDEFVDGHDCRGKGKDGYCWYLINREIRLLHSSISGLLRERGENSS